MHHFSPIEPTHHHANLGRAIALAIEADRFCSGGSTAPAVRANSPRLPATDVAPRLGRRPRRLWILAWVLGH